MKPLCLVAGGGAMGSLTAGYLRRAGHEVLLADGWHRNVEAIRAQGLRVRAPDEEFTVSLPALHLDQLAELPRSADIVFLSVKSYDTEWMARAVAPYLAADGFVISVQNGVNEPRIAAVVGAERTVGCVVHMAGGLFEPGVATRYSRSSWGTYSLGELDGRLSERIQPLADMMGAAGITHVTSNILGELWAKLALNAMSNGLTGSTGLSSGVLWADRRAALLMARIGGEVAAVSARLGLEMEPVLPTGAPSPLTPELLLACHRGEPKALDEVVELFAAAARTRKGPGENLSSLLQDVLKGRRTEIEYLNGHIVREGARVSVAAPANAAMVLLVTDLELGRIEKGPDNLDRLDALIAAQPTPAG